MDRSRLLSVVKKHPAAYSILAALPLVWFYEVSQMLLGEEAIQYANCIDTELLDTALTLLFSLPHAMGNLFVNFVILAFAVGAYAKLRGNLSKGRLLFIVAEGILIGAFLCFVVIPFIASVLELFTELDVEPKWLQMGHASLYVSTGAGYYEELLFRVVLLSGILWLLRRLRVPYIMAMLLAVVASTLYFVAIHYGEVQTVGTSLVYTYRIVLGLAFSTVFLLRGFAVAAWSHTAHDVLFLF